MLGRTSVCEVFPGVSQKNVPLHHTKELALPTADRRHLTHSQETLQEPWLCTSPCLFSSSPSSSSRACGMTLKGRTEGKNGSPRTWFIEHVALDGYNKGTVHSPPLPLPSDTSQLSFLFEVGDNFGTLAFWLVIIFFWYC